MTLHRSYELYDLTGADAAQEFADSLSPPERTSLTAVLQAEDGGDAAGCRAMLTTALRAELIGTLAHTHRTGTSHVETPGLCKALALVAGREACTDALTRSIAAAVYRTLLDLGNGIADDHGYTIAELLERQAADTQAAVALTSGSRP